MDEIDWTSMRHAYGPATEMPEVLRGLVAKRKRIRSWAQDCMWGGIHHQGDVYECTLRAVPFLLEAAAAPGVPGRPTILRLLASIGSAEVDDLGRLPETGGLWRAAQPAVAEGHPTFLALLADDRKKVRRAATEALLVDRERTAETLSALRGRLAVEKDVATRAAVIEAIGVIARRLRAGRLHGADFDELLGWLGGLAAGSPHPDVRLAAFTERLRLTDEPDDDLATTLYDMLGATDAIDLRDLREALGDRVTVRNTLLARTLREGPPARKNNAMWAASGATSHWRGDYSDVMLACVELLPDPRTRPLGLRMLTGDSWPLVAPVADRVFEFVEAALDRGAPVYAAQKPDFWSFDGGTVWALTTTLAKLRDPRVLPIIARALEEDALPVDCRPPLFAYRDEIVPLVPLLRRQIRRTIAAGDHQSGLNLLWHLHRAGPAAAEALPEVSALVPYDDFWGESLRALAVMGPAAAPALPLVRERLADGDPRTVGHAAEALAAIEGGTAEAELRALLADADAHVRTGAANGLRAIGVPAVEVLHAYAEDDYWSLRTIGPDAAPLVPRLRAAVETARWPEGVLTLLWQITGDTGTYLPALMENFTRERSRHNLTAEIWAEMGPAAAAAEPLLRAELANPVRATYRPNSHGSSDVEDDEAFVTTCRRALAAVTATG
ncbi:HEAT repeat domain-containing protein [Actinoplanes sichuanensis]|uniref:HEAT repeat domain-containing protein n=1 Tax=Actinoplanes sichuanensis TaxID=512349 RepID=A0ABW4A612_9ACTN|nr:HEAT repeat domain-containing protein [Actinoplanes sichuanensis]